MYSSDRNDARKEILALYLNIASGKLLLNSCYFTIDQDPESLLSLLEEVHSRYNSRDYTGAEELASILNNNCGDFADAEIPEFSPLFMGISVVAALGIFFFIRKRYS